MVVVKQERAKAYHRADYGASMLRRPLKELFSNDATQPNRHPQRLATSLVRCDAAERVVAWLGSGSGSGCVDVGSGVGGSAEMVDDKKI